MRILSISNCPLVEWQGSGNVILNFTRGLRKRGHEVDLFGPENFRLIKALENRGKRYRQSVGMLLFVLRQLKSKDYDLIEFYGAESWLAISFLSMHKNRRYPLIVHSNGLETHVEEAEKKHSGLSGERKKWYQLDLGFLFERAFRLCDGIVVVSEFDRGYALSHRYKDQGHVVTIENCLPESFLGLPIEFNRRQVIGYCGSWISRKDIKCLQEDAVRLLREFPGLAFKIMGPGNDFKAGDHFPEDVCSRIEVTPVIKEKEDMIRAYRNISILLFPSIYESFGLVTVEAMACGCAVVTTKTGFAAGVENRKEAMIMEGFGSPFLYNAARELLLDEALRLRIARAGYNLVQSLRWEQAVGRLESTYQSWLKERIQKE